MRKPLMKLTPISTNGICSPDYLRPQDFIRPLAVSAIFDCFIFLVVAGVYTLAHPSTAELIWGLAFQITAFLLLLDASITGISALAYSANWRLALQKHGPSAFQRTIEVDMPRHQAFELALGATTQVKKGKLLKVDEDTGIIQVLAAPNWWNVRRCVQLSVTDRNGKSRIAISSYLALPERRRKSLAFFWGEKWLPILLSTNNKENKRLTGCVADFIEMTPDWDHHYLPKIAEQ